MGEHDTGVGTDYGTDGNTTCHESRGLAGSVRCGRWQRRAEALQHTLDALRAPEVLAGAVGAADIGRPGWDRRLIDHMLALAEARADALVASQEDRVDSTRGEDAMDAGELDTESLELRVERFTMSCPKGWDNPKSAVVEAATYFAPIGAYLDRETLMDEAANRLSDADHLVDEVVREAKTASVEVLIKRAVRERRYLTAFFLDTARRLAEQEAEAIYDDLTSAEDEGDPDAERGHTAATPGTH